MASPYLGSLTKGERQDKANKMAREKCMICSKDYQNGCTQCIWYYIMNEMVGEQPELPQSL